MRLIRVSSNLVTLTHAPTAWVALLPLLSFKQQIAQSCFVLNQALWNIFFPKGKPALGFLLLYAVRCSHLVLYVSLTTPRMVQPYAELLGSYKYV